MTEQELYAMTPQQLTEVMLTGLVLQYDQAILARDANRFDEVNERLQKLISYSTNCRQDYTTTAASSRHNWTRSTTILPSRRYRSIRHRAS